MADVNDQQTTRSRFPTFLTALTVAAAVLVGQVVGLSTENWIAGTAAGLAIGLIGFAIGNALASKTAER